MTAIEARFTQQIQDNGRAIHEAAATIREEVLNECELAKLGRTMNYHYEEIERCERQLEIIQTARNQEARGITA